MNEENNYMFFVAKLITTEYIIGKRLNNGDYDDPVNIEYNDEEGFYLIPYLYPLSDKKVKIGSEHVICEFPLEEIDDQRLLDDYYELIENVPEENTSQLH